MMPINCTLKLAAKSAPPTGSDLCEQRSDQRARRDLWRVRERASDLFRLMEVEVVERGYEGYVAKDEASAHEGGPTRRWPKVKERDWTVEKGPAGTGGPAGHRRLADRRRQSRPLCRLTSARIRSGMPKHSRMSTFSRAAVSMRWSSCGIHTLIRSTIATRRRFSSNEFDAAK